MIRIALATAHVLGLKKIRIEAKSLPTTAHFMTTGRCLYDCSFCTQARSSKRDEQYLSRVVWPEFEKEKIKEILRKKLDRNFKRICLQVTQSINYFDQTLSFIDYIKGLSRLPISVSIRLKSMGEAQVLFDKGVDQLGLSLDVVDHKDFLKIKKSNYNEFLKFLLSAGRRFPGRITTHIIIGFSETEKQVIELIRNLYRNNVSVALFAFTPVRETAFEDKKPPDLSKYRKIQLAHLMIKDRWKYRLRFDKEGNLRSIGWNQKNMKEKLENSKLFQTSGCPDCNRPYYNERSSGKLYNYPYKLSQNEFRQAIEDLHLEVK